MNNIKEGKAVIKVPEAERISKQMDVFYNPVMKLNRDISVLLLNSIDKSKLNIADPLAGTGIRSIRFLLELKKSKIEKISINDHSVKSIKLIKSNLKLNKINKKIKLYNQDANLFLLNSTGFDYIDIDPFGTPNPFLDSAVKRLGRNGILAVTATDTSALCGTFPKACLRKYWAMPKKGAIMHETGLRILIRKVQLIGSQYEKALTPIFSYSKEHYMRVFFHCKKGKTMVDKVLEQHGHYNNAGPIWLGRLWGDKLINKMLKSIENEPLRKNPLTKKIKNKELTKFLKIIKNESKIDTIGFYDIHKICKKHKIKQIPKKSELIKKIKKLGYKSSETHFNPEAIRSNINLKSLLKVLKS